MNQKLKGEIGIYLIDNNGLTIYSQSIGSVDPQLIGGLSMAILNFSATVYGMNTTPEKTIIKTESGKDTLESRLIKGENTHCLLLLKNIKGLTSNAYSVLDELSKSLTMKEGLNKKEIENYVNNQIRLMKEQMHSSYLLEILSEAIYYGVKTSEATMLIPRINEAYKSSNYNYIHSNNNYVNDRVKDLTLSDKPKTIKRIISKVNHKNKAVWELFEVPLINIKEL